MPDKKYLVGQEVFHFKHGFGVVEFSDTSYLFGVKVSFFHGTDSYIFTNDGKMNVTDSHPSLLTVDQAALLGYHPPKKKVLKVVEMWMNVSTDVKSFHFSKESADMNATQERIECVKLVGSYETEEE